MAKGPLNRRSFLKTAAGRSGSRNPSKCVDDQSGEGSHGTREPCGSTRFGSGGSEYPRRFRGRQLSDDLVSAGRSGGRESWPWRARATAQLGDLQPPEQGLIDRPMHFLAIWAQAGDRQAGGACAGSHAFCLPMRDRMVSAQTTCPGCRGLNRAIFTGEYPLAHIEFRRLHFAGQGRAGGILAVHSA